MYITLQALHLSGNRFTKFDSFIIEKNQAPFLVDMKISLILIVLGQSFLRAVLGYNDAGEGLSNRALATCPVGGLLDATGKYCCPASCGQCGGSGCDKRVGGSAACCTSKITKSCSTSGLPCIASGGSSKKCPTGSIMDASGKTCCSAACGQCGGSGCHLRPGGAAACCTSQVSISCSAGKLPCLLSGTATSPPANPPGSKSCPAGSIADSTGKVCCPSSCGTCGGNGCHLRPGGAAACCTSQVTKSCTGNKPPCLASGAATPPPATNKCPAGGILDASGKVCCTASCGTCGGSGCDSRTGGSANCCTSKITAPCAAGKLPCVLGGNTATPTPTPTPTPKPTPKPSAFCADGTLTDVNYADNFYDTLYCSMQICCPKSCSKCDIDPSCTNAPECCVYDLFWAAIRSDVDISCRTQEPPCIVPPINDPCESTSCLHGAPCGVGFQYQWWGEDFKTQCFLTETCKCKAVGNYYGPSCELQCGEGETACGESLNGYRGATVTPNDKCCTANEECIRSPYKYGVIDACYSKDRPKSCDPNPCKNEGECLSVNGNEVPIYQCYCKEGFGGILCENRI